MSIKKYTMRTHTHTNTNTNTNTQKNKPVSTHKIVSRKLCNILFKPCKNSKHKTHTIILKENKVELLLLFNTLLNYFILLKQNNASRITYKKKIIELLKVLRTNNKLIHNDTTDTDINNMYISIYKYFTQIIQNLYNKCDRIYNDIDIDIDKSNKFKVKYRKQNKQNTSQNTSHDGGFYFKNIEEKGDAPITGTDISKLLDEMQQFFYNAKYTTEGAFLNETDTLISMFRGDISQFKGFLQYKIFPQYYKPFPPFINWKGVNEAIETKKWEDIPDYLLAYQSYLRSQDEYLVEKGLKPASELNKGLYTGVFDKIARSLDSNIQQFQQFRNKAQGKFFPIAVPI